MKYLPLLALLFLLGCEDQANTGSVALRSTYDFAASPDQDTAQYIPLYIHDYPAEADINASPVATGAWGQILQPDMSHFQAALLVKDYWVIDGYADMNGSREQRRWGIGQWFNFNANGTFTGGMWNHQTHAGAWYMDYQGKSPRLTIDSNVDRLDAIYELQAINGPRDNIGLVRINDGSFGVKTPDGIQMRLTNLTNMPTKQQYARELNID